ncbi:MAG: hypothetical protein ABIQ35_09990, partial [Verrucomicrobiota bacterium]
MFFKSIRFRLQLWYGVILIAVLFGFGITAYQLERGRLLRRIDDGLQRRVSALAGSLKPPRNLGPGDRPIANPPPDDQPPPGRPRPNRPFQNSPPDDFPRRPFEFHLPPERAALFDASDTNGFFYIIRRRDGEELARSTNAPQDVGNFPKASPHERADPPLEPRANPPEPQPSRMRGALRELFIITPLGETILVGRFIAPELGELKLVAFTLAAVGSGVLLLGLAGGWWIAARAIRPVEDISATAV